MHVSLLSTILIVLFTRNVIKDFNLGYNEWRQSQVIRGFEPMTQEIGTIARLYEFETNSMAFFYNVLVVVVIALTFYVDLYFIY